VDTEAAPPVPMAELESVYASDIFVFVSSKLTMLLSSPSHE